MNASMALNVPARGDFDHLCVVGGFAPALEDGHRRLTYHGLVLETTSSWGTFRDGRGTLFAVRRTLGWDWARPLTVHTSEAGRLRLRKDVLTAAYAGSGLEDELDAHRHEYRSPPSRPGPRYRLRRSVARIDWREDGILDLAGALVGGCGLQWYDPSAPGAAGASLLYRARGVVLDEAVEGFLVFEQRYLPSGHVWPDTPYLRGPRLQIAWVTFATEWDDGSLEFGHLCAGRRSWGFATIADESGPTVLTTDVTVDVDLGDGVRSSIAFASSDQQWEWRADGSTLEPMPLEAHTAAEGLVQRRGDARTPRTWMARLEQPGPVEER